MFYVLNEKLISDIEGPVAAAEYRYGASVPEFGVYRQIGGTDHEIHVDH